MMSRSVLFAFAPKKTIGSVVICPGRIESYAKYAELAYDLFHSGFFDVMIIDHRGRAFRRMH